MDKKEIKTDMAPAAIGPYSQGVRAGGFVFVSGQIPVHPKTGDIVPGGVKEETRRVLLNIKAVLEKEGLNMADVVKTTVYLTDLSLFKEMNEAYSEFFGHPYPARATIGVMALPKGVSVEIDAIAQGLSSPLKIAGTGP
ncbi:MAG: RidA family protein [Deltaproteobacteria bacterium]